MKINKQTIWMSLAVFGAIAAAVLVVYFVRGGDKTSPKQEAEEVVSKPSATAAPIFQIAGQVCTLGFEIPCTPGLTCTSKKAYQNAATNVAGTYTLTNEISAGSSVSRGQILVYQLNYANTGTGAVPSATFSDTIPTGVTFLDSQAACSYAAATRVVTCTLNNIPAGATGSVSFRVTVNSDASGSFTNTATLTPSTGATSDCSIPLNIPGSSSSPSPSPSTSAGSANLDCLYKRAYLDDARNRAGFYYLESQITDTASLRDGQTIVYNIATRNHGTLAVSDVTITDVLSSSLTFVDADNGCSYDATSRRVTCNVGSIAPQTEISRSIRVRITASGNTTIENTADVFSTNGQRDTCYLRVDASGRVVVEPSPSPRVTTLPNAGVFEVTAGTLGLGVLFLLIGAIGLLMI